MFASQRMCIIVKEICEHTWNLTKTASSFFFIPSIFPGSCIYDRALRNDDQPAQFFTESDISISSLKVECQHSTQGRGREISTCRAHQYSFSMVLIILLGQN